MSSHSPDTGTPKTSCRVLPASYLSTGSRKKSKASTTTLGRAKFRQMADFKGYEIYVAINKQMDNSIKATRSVWG